MPHIKQKIVTIVTDPELSESDKIAALRQLEADSLSKERSATEGMTPIDGDDGEDLKNIELALQTLGEQPFDKGAASV